MYGLLQARAGLVIDLHGASTAVPLTSMKATVTPGLGLFGSMMT